MLHLRELIGCGLGAAFSFIRENGLKITRLDVAYDDHTGVIPLGEIVNDTQSGIFISKSNCWETVLSSKSSTVQIGSPQSRVLIRIYDKAMERSCLPGTHWIRCEILKLQDPIILIPKIKINALVFYDDF